jgi:hypothetical protein
MAHRIGLSSVDAVERQTLVGLMLTYLTDDVVDDHVRIVHSGVDFFIGYRAYLGGMEAWLAANGGARFVPLPEWTPDNPIPDEFDVVRDMDDGTPRLPLVNLNPNLYVPPELAPGQLCGFESGDELANAVNAWHGSVHGTVGGAMGDFTQAPAAPVFWCWHAFLDDVYYDWEACQLTRDGARPHGHGRPEPDEFDRNRRVCEERQVFYEEHPLAFDDEYRLPLYTAPLPSYQSTRL